MFVPVQWHTLRNSRLMKPCFTGAKLYMVYVYTRFIVCRTSWRWFLKMSSSRCTFDSKSSAATAVPSSIFQYCFGPWIPHGCGQQQNPTLLAMKLLMRLLRARVTPRHIYIDDKVHACRPQLNTLLRMTPRLSALTKGMSCGKGDSRKALCVRFGHWPRRAAASRQ